MVINHTVLDQWVCPQTLVCTETLHQPSALVFETGSLTEPGTELTNQSRPAGRRPLVSVLWSPVSPASHIGAGGEDLESLHASTQTLFHKYNFLKITVTCKDHYHKNIRPNLTIIIYSTEMEEIPCVPSSLMTKAEFGVRLETKQNNT